MTANAPIEDADPPPGFDFYHPTPADFSSIDWQAVSDAPFKHFHELAARYNSARGVAKEEGDQRAERVFGALGEICSISLRLDAHHNPLAAAEATETFRLPGVDDLPEETIDCCEALAAQARCAPLRARMSDIVWLRKRDHVCAGIAVEAYLAAANDIDPSSWSPGFRLIERAAQIGGSLGRGNLAIQSVVLFVRERLNRFADIDDGFLSAKLMRLLLEVGGGNEDDLAAKASALADRASAAKSYHRARSYLEIVVDVAARQKNDPRRRDALLQIAESYVSEANHAIATTGVHLVAAMHLQHAIEAFRRAGKAKSRIGEVHAQLLEVQAKGAKELIPTVVSHDITEIITAAEKLVGGKDLEQSLTILATCCAIPEVASLKRQAELNAERYIGQSLFPKALITPEGKTIAKPGSVRSTDAKEREAALRAEMFEMAARHHGISAQATIDPIRQRILADHVVRLEHFRELVAFHPLVPPGREMLFADGLFAGFTGDLPKAAHLLIPQLEHAVRVLLHRSGVRVSTFDKYGLQNELNLNNLLYEPKLVEILGDDAVFALQGLLVEKFGSNLRNRLAHGLMGSGEFYTYPVLYLWWFTFRLCMLPRIALANEAAVAELNQPPEGPLSS